jgi:ABC-type branched-subunit amino acid transport system substrate-binding protein
MYHSVRFPFSSRVRAPLIAAIVAALVAAGCGSSASSSAGGGPDTGTGALVFAAFNPFSGPDASFGPEEMAGCIPAAAAIQAAGGILDHKQVSCKAVDTRGDPADAVPAAQQLIASTSGLMGIIGPSSDEASATVPLFNRAHIPMFLDSGQKVFDKSTLPYLYRITAPDDAVGYAMALYAHQKGYIRAAGVFGNDISSQGTAPTAAAGFRKLGGTIVMQTIPLDQSSYRTEIEQIISSKPQVIFNEADPQTSGTFFAELRQLYGLVPIIGTNGTNQPPWFKAVGGAIGQANLAKYYAGAQPYAPVTGPAYVEWRKELAAVATKVPQPVAQWESDSYSMSYWDNVNLMALAAQAAKSANPAVFNPYIVKVAAPSPGAVIVHSFAAGKAALAAGKKIQYVGAVGSITFDQYRNSPGQFEIVTSDGHTAIATYTAAQVAAAR